MTKNQPLLEVEDLSITYRTGNDDVRAITEASFTIENGEYLGLVGESGSGKSTIAKAIIGGLDPNAEIVSGTIRLNGEEIQSFSDVDFSEEIRWNKISYIPQASMDSLDPIMRISDQAQELAEIHTEWTDKKALDRLKELFKVVGLPQARIHDYPHEFSGGMEQRALIALALLLNPSMIIADEPTTALDVIMQDQILQYLEEIKTEVDLSILLITHDISVVFETCDSVAVLHGGQVAESGPATALFDRPAHPYTYLLQRAFPDIRAPHQELQTIGGKPPELKSEVTECTFAERCPWAVSDCRTSAPPLEEAGETGDHVTSCIRHEEIEEIGETDRANSKESAVVDSSAIGGDGHE
jgi:oligopeptide/dipeptide ABC transporter ATP-binding protein